MDLSKSYSKFIYCTQLIVLEFGFRRLLDNNNYLSLNNIIKSFIDNYFHNISFTALSEVLNNRNYCFKVNKEINIQIFISINYTLKETISYKKVTISVDNLRDLFKSLLSSANSLLKESLLFDIPLSKYKDINLKEFSKFEDRSNSVPFQCFRDFSPNSEANKSFLKNKVFNNTDLFKAFFKYNRDSKDLKLNFKRVKLYLNDLL
jgi:hypothetical protein